MGEDKTNVKDKKERVASSHNIFFEPLIRSNHCFVRVDVKAIGALQGRVNTAVNSG